LTCTDVHGGSASLEQRRLARLRRAIVILMAGWIAAVSDVRSAAQAPPASGPPLAQILQRAAGYVDAYQRDLRGIVAEETYLQNMTATRGSGRRVAREYRQLKSDLLLVKLGVEERWMQFRDVFEVDRKPIRERDQRLYNLFVQATPDARLQAEQLQKESSRYNLGPIMRTINIPIMALFVFDKFNQFGIRFELGDAGNVKRLANLAPVESIAVVHFRETTKETLVRGEQGRDVPSHGRAWIDHRNGRILETEIISQDTTLRAEINVRYKVEPNLTVLVPDEMRELYTIPRYETRIDGRAKYDHFRQFTVSTMEKPKG
jgi:hypothetical protein